MTPALATGPADIPHEELRRRWKEYRRARREERTFSLHRVRGWRLVLTILGFIAFPPLGFALLAFFAWRNSMTCTAAWTAPWMNRVRDRLPTGAPRSTGNLAFDEHRAAVLARLEEERRALDAQQAEFTAFVAQLRRAKDQEEFDRFMADRGGRAV